MASIYKNTKVNSFRTKDGKLVYYKVIHSGSYLKTQQCPRCNKTSVLSYRSEPISNPLGLKHLKNIHCRIYVYACRSCELEFIPKVLKSRNEKSVIEKTKFENQNELITAILSIHNKRGAKDLRLTTSHIESSLGLKQRYLEKKINQNKYYRSVDQDMIDDINSIKV